MKNNIEKRINRVIGQLEAIKVKLNDPQADCESILVQLKAITGSTKSLARLIADEEIRKCVSPSLSEEEAKKISLLLKSIQ